MKTDKTLLMVDGELQRQIAELSGPMHEVCRYATEGGGRVRAALLLGAAQQSGEHAMRAATSLELIHAATLLQDDIFDAGQMRRGRVAAHVQFGKAMTILASDWLLIRSLEMAAEVDTQFFRCLARAGTAMAQAEARELAPPALRSMEEAQQYGCTIARGKTAMLFGTAMCGAAVLQRVAPDDRSRWEEMGVEMGLTYQMVDDCVDIYGAETGAGKSVGHDLVAGCLTMPVLFGAFLMEKEGAHVSIEELQAGRLGTAESLQLQRAVRSPEVMGQLHELLQRRFADHRKRARETGVPESAVEVWSTNLRTKLTACWMHSAQPQVHPFADRMFLPRATRQRYA